MSEIATPPLRRGDWMQLYSGGQFWPLDPRREDVEIRDIAHALALLCRYNGHVPDFFSVAQHSVLVSRIVEADCDCPAVSWGHDEPRGRRQHALWGLLHDAAEAYLGDIHRPLKPYLHVLAPDGVGGRGWLVPFGGIERGIIHDAVSAAFAIPPDPPACIKPADECALVTEYHDLFPRATWDHLPAIERWPDPALPWTWQQAEQRFLARFRELTKASYE